MYGQQSSRRFACDRCRTYKLRCERHHPISGAVHGCERCSKAGVMCKTTTPTNNNKSAASSVGGSVSASASSIPSQHVSHHSQNHHGGYLAVAEHWGGSSRNGDLQSVGEVVGSMHSAQLQQQQQQQQSPPDSRPLSSNRQHQHQHSNSIPRSDSQNTLSDTSSGHGQGSVNPMHLTQPTVSPQRNGNDIMGLEEADQVNSIDFMMVDFGCNDGTNGATNAADQQDQVGMVGPTSTGSTDVFNLSPQSLDSDELQSPLRDAMNFCAALIEHYHSFKNANRSPPNEASPKLIEQPIQSALEHTSRLLEILEGLAATEAPPHQHRQMGRHHTSDGSSSHSSAFGGAGLNTSAVLQGSMPGTHAPYADSDCNDSNSSSGMSTSRQESYDVLLMTTLVTSYVYLIRTWRSVFSLLHHLLLATAPGQMRGLLKLPSLHFGGFRILNNPSIQIQVLLELRADLVQRIEAILGIGPSASYGSGRYGDDTERHKTQPAAVFSVNPFAVSIRETLLHQERLRAATEDGTGDLSLKDIAGKVKQLLDAQS